MLYYKLISTIKINIERFERNTITDGKGLIKNCVEILVNKSRSNLQICIHETENQ